MYIFSFTFCEEDSVLFILGANLKIKQLWQCSPIMNILRSYMSEQALVEQVPTALRIAALN